MIMKSQYGLGGDGLPGNDDYGTMSAWFLWAALGLFPRASTQTYILGSPLVSSARIYRRLPSGLKAFNVFVQGNSARGYKV
jgi:putative alpha-1,2-mannosidase